MSRTRHASPLGAGLTRRQFVRALSLSALVSSSGVPHLASAAEPVKIGTLLDLTGALEAYGKPIQNGAILAAEHIYSPPCTRASLREAARGAPNRASYHASDSARPERTSCVGA